MLGARQWQPEAVLGSLLAIPGRGSTARLRLGEDQSGSVVESARRLWRGGGGAGSQTAGLRPHLGEAYAGSWQREGF